MDQVAPDASDLGRSRGGRVQVMMMRHWSFWRRLLFYAAWLLLLLALALVAVDVARGRIGARGAVVPAAAEAAGGQDGAGDVRIGC